MSKHTKGPWFVHDYRAGNQLSLEPKENQTMIDFNKPVQTLDGRKARVLCTDLTNPEYPIAVEIIHNNLPASLIAYPEDGKFDGNRTSPADLINVPETRVVWVNMYPSAVGTAIAFGYETNDIADEFAGGAREACIRVEYTVGQFDEEPDNGK